MTDAHKAAVEAAINEAACAFEDADPTVAYALRDTPTEAAMRAAITAYLAAMAAEGWVMVRDVTIAATSDTPPEFVMGWNACRTAMLGDNA